MHASTASMCFRSDSFLTYSVTICQASSRVIVNSTPLCQVPPRRLRQHCRSLVQHTFVDIEVRVMMRPEFVADGRPNMKEPAARSLGHIREVLRAHRRLLDRDMLCAQKVKGHLAHKACRRRVIDV